MLCPSIHGRNGPKTDISASAERNERTERGKLHSLGGPFSEASRDKTDQRAVRAIAREGEVRRRVAAGQMKVGNMGTLLDLKQTAGAAWRKGLSRRAGEPDLCQVQLVRSAKVFDGALERVLVQVSASRCS